MLYQSLGDMYSVWFEVSEKCEKKNSCWGHLHLFISNHLEPIESAALSQPYCLCSYDMIRKDVPYQLFCNNQLSFFFLLSVYFY